MYQSRFKILAAGAIVAIAGIGISSAVTAPVTQASGHGTLFVTNSDGQQVRRQFSLSGRKNPDGTVKGNAVLHNPAFTVDNGQNYMLQIDISCMNVVGNTVFFGGTTKRTNDPTLVDAVFFSVEDNGEPGAGSDKISQAMFWDDDPTTTGDPMACLNNVAGDFEMLPIESGNIQVRL